MNFKGQPEKGFVAKLVAPFAPLYRVWMKFSHVLGYINTRLLLAAVFFLVITPLALLMRLFGRDVLALRQEKRESYWQVQDKRWLPDSFRNRF
jgi:hypothetical protein